MMGMMWGGNQVQRLLEETARQPDILYLMVVDENGRVLAHNNPAIIGSILERMPAAAQAESWRLTDLADGGQAFEVFRLFKPLQGGRGGGRHGMGRHRQAAYCPPGIQGQAGSDWCFPTDPDNSNQIIFAGFDLAPFNEARREDIRNTIAISGVLALLGLAGFVSIIWAHHYRTAKRSLQDASAFAREVVASLPVGLIATDPQERIAFFNSSAETITGISFDRARGRKPEAVLPTHWCGLKEVMSAGAKVIEREIECTFAAGRTIPLSVSASRITNDDGDLVGHVIILRDLGEIKTLQDEIRRTEKLAALGGLAAGVAHEIRNPLSSIKGMASYFGNKFADGSDDQAAARVMIDEVDRLNRVISELLDFARPSDLNRQPTDVSRMIAHSLKLIEQDAKSKQITLRSKIDLTPACRPAMDADRFSQCLLNLYLNAIQAMPAGGRLEVVAACTDNGGVHFQIGDTGKGIPNEIQSQIFDPYFTTKSDGTGLGLAIVHKIVEAHGGSISVHSRSGEGTRFRIILPPGGADEERE
jgi:two-component system sensor histidine kinase HydH